MKFLISFSVYLFLLGCSAGYAQKDCTGSLHIKTDSDSAVLFLNDSLAGTGSLQLELKPGRYTVEAKSGIRNWDNIVFSDSLHIACGEEKVLNYSFNSLVYIKSVPEDASVIFKDSILGHTPLHLPGSIAGLKLYKEGYDTLNLKDALTADESEFILKYSGREKTESFYRSTLFKYLIGGVVALGAATAYFKIRADKKFDEYQVTGEKSLLQQTRDYDLISGITMGALQVNFGVLIYYFLTD